MKQKKRIKINLLAIITLFFLTSISAFAFDKTHATFNEILKKNVIWNDKKTASVVNYAGIKKQDKILEKYLDSLSDVTKKEFITWNKNEQLAFLINAYNAFTIQLILTKYPNLKSIKELGGWFSGPWDKKFFKLFNNKISLNELEHNIIRKKGVYDEPRAHFALVCASIGCPGLQNKAFISDKLDKQLEDSLERFLSDKTRNRYNKENNKLEVSKIFDWYGSDFNNKKLGYTNLKEFFAKYANLLSNSNEVKNKIKLHSIKISYLDYDWNLNNFTKK